MPTSSTLAADVAHQRTCQASQLITESLSYAGPMNYDGTGILAQRFEPPGELCKAGSGSGSMSQGWLIEPVSCHSMAIIAFW